MVDDLQAIAQRMQAAWAQAFARKDWVELAALYTETPAFYGSTPELQTDRAGVQAYFEALPLSLAEARYAVPQVNRLGPDCFAASGDVMFVNRGRGGDAELAFRMTQAFVRDDEAWRIALHHASARPAPLLAE